MYVNELTLDYGDRGRAAVQRLLDEAWKKRLIPKPSTSNSAPDDCRFLHAVSRGERAMSERVD